ncbi:MAG: SRPBCC domain-containing protein [Polyangiaceae bacterium]
MKTLIDRENLTFTFQRTLRATPEDVFDAWTIEDEIASWWDPTGERLVECSIDLRPNGAFRFVNRGHSPPFAGVYKVVERPLKLVFEALGAEGVVQIEAQGELTHMQVTIRCGSAEHFETFIKIGVHEGTERTFDNLVRFIDTRRAKQAG